VDTREKILERADARAWLAAGAPATVVAGWFDPLLDEHCARLAELKPQGRRLLAVVLEREEAILPARARAELVAALGAVDAVVVGDPAPLESDYIDLDAEDAARSAAFSGFVTERTGPR
jgi:hypothetical protein